MEGGMQRLFLAVPLPDEVREAIRGFQERLVHKVRNVKWVNPNSMHITLKFLGDTPEHLIPNIKDAVRLAAAVVAPVELEVAGLGAFPSPATPRVLWVGLVGDTIGIAGLSARLNEELQTLGFEPEKRPFSAHVTLGRGRTGTRVQSITGLVQDFGNAQLATFVAGSLSLYQSELTPRGPTYTEQERFNFGG